MHQLSAKRLTHPGIFDVGHPITAFLSRKKIWITTFQTMTAHFGMSMYSNVPMATVTLDSPTIWTGQFSTTTQASAIPPEIAAR